MSGPGAAAQLRGLTIAPITVLATVTILTLVATDATQRLGPALAVTGLLVGLPHGAVDHLLPRWAELSSTRAATSALIGAYLVVAGLAAAALVLAPTAAVLTFLLLSALHFGTAETVFDTERRDRSTPRPWTRPLASSAHGATVVGLLLWVRPHEIDPWLRHLAPGAANVTAALRSPGLLVIGALILAQVTATLLRIRAAATIETGPTADAPAAPSRVVRVEALALAEQAVLLATFVTVPPLVALGLYFGCWHALRHTGRLLDVARRPGDHSWRPAGRRLAIASILPTAAALSAMAGLLLIRDRAPLIVEVAVLLALTFPHSAAVWSLDLQRHRRQPQHRGYVTR